jgi:hypothetical protein
MRLDSKQVSCQCKKSKVIVKIAFDYSLTLLIILPLNFEVLDWDKLEGGISCKTHAASLLPRHGRLTPPLSQLIAIREMSSAKLFEYIKCCVLQRLFSS